MKPNTTDRIIYDQIFKITKSDADIRDYLIDCGSPFNSKDIVSNIELNN
jgi:hypothetical protein